MKLKRNLLVEIELGVLGNDENEDGNKKDINEKWIWIWNSRRRSELTFSDTLLEDCVYEILQLQLKKEVLDIELEKQK